MWVLACFVWEEAQLKACRCVNFTLDIVLQVKCLTQTAFKCEFKLSQQKMQLFFVNICLYLHSSNLLKLPVRFSFAVV